MPTNKVVADDDPEYLELLKGGGLKKETIKDRERFLAQFKEFVVRETGGMALEELVGSKEGLERLDLLFPKYFLTMEVVVTEKGQALKRRQFRPFRDTPSFDACTAERNCTKQFDKCVTAPYTPRHVPRTCPGGGIGRRAGFRCQWLNGREGSSPFLGTTNFLM